MASHIESLTVENFGCVKHAELKLTPIHALIGPNDSGKSTLLAALRSLLEAARFGEVDVRTDGARLRATAGELVLSVSSSKGQRDARVTHQGRGHIAVGHASHLETVLPTMGEDPRSIALGVRSVRLLPDR